MLPALPEPSRDELGDGLGSVGEAGPTDTRTLVRRFLDGAFADPPDVPTAAALAEGLDAADGAVF